MKSTRMFASKARAARPGPTSRNRAGGSAGNSTGGGGNPASGDGYKAGALGWRSGRQAGGETMGQKMADLPTPTDTSLKGAGGLAWDKTAAEAMDEPRVLPERTSISGSRRSK
jgi:hypothetical protein